MLVHGIGNTRKDWADKIIPAVQSRLKSKLNKILGPQAPATIDEVGVVTYVYWEGVFNDRQNKLKVALDGFPKPVKAGGSWWNIISKWWHRFLNWIWRFFKKLQNEIITNYISDIVGYLHSDSQKAVYSKVSAVLQGCASRIGSVQAKIPLTFIAHSLGTVITSDYIYEQNNPKSDTARTKIMKECFVLDNLFTVGSPISLFSLRFGGPEMFTNPVAVENPSGRWVNIFDEDDPVGMPLKVLNEAYNKVVHKDVLVNSGVYGISHTNYFKRSSKVLDIICQKLAIDWIALNQKLPQADIERLYAEYDETVGLLK